MSPHVLTKAQVDTLLHTLHERFTQHKNRHKDVDWTLVVSRLHADRTKFWSLSQMEQTGGEPDVVSMDGDEGKLLFVDCVPQSPQGRRSLCYDPAALEARKEHKPRGSALDMAKSMGIELLTEEQYRSLQELGEFDTTTSSWIQTPPNIRKLGGALFADRRYDTVFVYHNGADSYYAARGFRGSLRV